MPFTLETLWIILPYVLTLTMVGLLKSLMTAAIVGETTDTTSDKNRECAGQGLANITFGLFGGMAGCVMVGQSVVNASSGERGRLSCLWAGALLLSLTVVPGPWVKQIPMAALVAVMVMVSINTFQWRSIRTLVTHPKGSSVVMPAVVAVVVATRDLAKGVLVGVVLSGLFFAQTISRFFGVTSAMDGATGTRTYRVTGRIFFATAEAFHIIGMNEAGQALVDRLTLHDKPGAALPAGGHRPSGRSAPGRSPWCLSAGSIKTIGKFRRLLGSVQKKRGKVAVQ